MARRTNRSTSKPNSCAESATRMRARPRPMSSYACDYGAGGAALFDIVNVQIWTRRRASAHPQGRFHTGSGAAILLSIFKKLA